MLCATLFIRVCAHEGICVSQCPFWRSSSVSKIRFFYHCVCFLCSKQNVNHFRVMYIKHVRHTTPLLSHHGTAVFTLPSNRLRVINNPSINVLHRNRSIPEIPDTEICCSETLRIFKYKTQILQYLTWLSMCKYRS